MSDFIYGRHAVQAALDSGQAFNKMWVAEGAEQNIAHLVAKAKQMGVPVAKSDRRKLDALVGGENHQGVVISLAEEAFVELSDLLARIAPLAEQRFLVLLDGLEDPHNVGAILRTAEAAGAQGLVMPRHRSVGLTGGVAKASVGALSRVPVARVSNLVAAIEEIKQAGFWVIGADQKADQLYTDARLTGPVAIVVGAEGKGMSRLTKEHCDVLVRIPMAAAVASLNASVAGALLLYEVVRQRGGPGR